MISAVFRPLPPPDLGAGVPVDVSATDLSRLGLRESEGRDVEEVIEIGLLLGGAPSSLFEAVKK
jgi:hypothetical protein